MLAHMLAISQYSLSCYIKSLVFRAGPGGEAEMEMDT